jgi:arginyl-tRNA synthetase
MKSTITHVVQHALGQLPDLAEAAADLVIESTVERTRDRSHGDFASNVAMRLAKPARKSPRDIAAAIIEQLPHSDQIDKVEIAGPGFINFYLSPGAYHAEVASILEKGRNYGRQEARTGPRILLEFVSANPTGPLHVGHGRHAAYGACINNLLKAVGYPVDSEYYVNDAGRQMEILGVSVYLRALEESGMDIRFPSAGYRGDYVRDLLGNVFTGAARDFNPTPLFEGLPTDDKDHADAYIDALIRNVKEFLGEEVFDRIRQESLEAIRADIEVDLEEFGVTYDRWYSEQSLTTSGQIDAALAVLDERGMLYEQDGATWFRATKFGDEKDRVVIRENGVKTYFASDIAYHFDKRERGYEHLINVLGSDHHGYVSRLQGGLDAMGYNGDDLEVELMQFVTLFRGTEKLAMSTRSGEFVTLRQLRDEVGNDAARFFYVMRSHDQPLDFDLELAKSHSNDNPVYYIQYAHARICSVFRQLAEKSIEQDADNGSSSMGALTEPQEAALMTSLSRYPEIIELAANNRAPQHLVHYLRDLANDFHSYYNAHQFIVDDDKLRDARLALISATRIVIFNGLTILGVSAPDSM